MTSDKTPAHLVPTVAQLRREGRALLASLREDAQPEADYLLATTLQQGRAWLLAHADDRVSLDDAARYRAWLQRRAAGEPAAYLTGVREFWSLPLRVSPAVLVPRPDTEILVAAALDRLAADRVVNVADLGTGSGAIAVAIATERPRARIVATDESGAALDVARANAAALGVSNRVEFRQGDWLQALDASLARSFDAIVSNPPYIAVGDAHLGEGGLPFEPATALASGHDGLDAIRRIAAGVSAFLTRGGWLLLEHGSTQGAAVRALLRDRAFASVETITDLEGRDRVTLGRRA